MISSPCHSKNMKDFLLDLRDIILYDLLKKTPPKLKKLELELDFIAHKEKGGGIWLEAKNYPGLIASGDTPEELRKALWDSILTYFDVPRSYAKRLKDKLILRLPNGKVVEPKIPFWEREIKVQVATT